MLWVCWAQFSFWRLFIWLESRHPQPMIDLRLFRNALFSQSLLTGALVFVVIAGATLLLPFYLQDMRGYNARKLADDGFDSRVFGIIAAPLSGIVSDRYGTRIIAMIGLAITAVGFWLMSRFDAQTAVLGFALGVMPMGLGIGVFQSPNNSAVMGIAAPGIWSIASGLLGLSRTLGQTAEYRCVFGALWAGRVAAYAGETLPGGATTAPGPAQIAGLSDTFLAMLFLTVMALLLSVWGIVRARQTGSA
ncbi:MAG: MFS transporter [Ardenticatenaceae bacterium]|nr:MFS transporter [Ardenticatenaceae bacterium]